MTQPSTPDVTPGPPCERADRITCPCQTTIPRDENYFELFCARVLASYPQDALDRLVTKGIVPTTVVTLVDQVKRATPR